MATSNRVFLNQDGHDCLLGNRHWFEDTAVEARVRDFTWHDLRQHVREQADHGGSQYSESPRTHGPQTINMTARYAHLEPAEQLAAVEKLVAFDQPRSRRTGERAGRKASPVAKPVRPRRRLMAGT